MKIPNPAPDTEEKTVHVYEMYWADLSQTANAFTRIFGELYQLLFHLGSVSVNNVLAAAIHFYGLRDEKLRSRWHAFSTAQGRAVAVLAWPIPILNLLMAAVVPVLILIALMRTHLSAKGEFIALDVLLAVAAIVVSGLGLRKFPTFPGFLYPLPVPVAGLLALFAGIRLPPLQKNSSEAIAAAVALVFTLGVVWLIVGAYEKRRPGTKAAALSIAGIVLVACLVIFAVTGVPAGGRGADYPVIAVFLNIFEVITGLLGLAWVVFFVLFVWAHFAGWRAVKTVPAGADRIKAARTRWTAQLILALSSIAFATLTVSIWTGVEKVTLQVLPGPPCTLKDDAWLDDGCVPVRYRPVSAVLYRAMLERAPRKYVSSPPLVKEWADQMLTLFGIAALPIYLTALLIALLFTVWAIFPSVLAELNPPTEPSQDASLGLGVWLDRGFRFMRWGGETLYWSFWLPPLLACTLYQNRGVFTEVIAIVGTVVAGMAVGIVGFSGRLKTLAGGLRPVLRVMLDVDNWLREHPRESNPTARICGRYVSLLRHISAWRDSDGSKYNAVIIVAHSQGAVISADLLRFLHSEKLQAGSMANYDPELQYFGEMPLYFCTMGCPLHQLYGLRFPYLYGWARNDVSREELEPGTVPDILPDDAPRPNRLGVERWINAYRSGDYVGRYLWRGGRGGYEWTPAATRYDQDWNPPAGKPAKVSADRAGSRIEFCIGPGAHTHYFDHTAETIAEVLDRMINNATEER